MRPSLLSAACLAGALTPLASAITTPTPPQPSDACVNDELLALLKASIRVARPFCREYLKIPVSVSYVLTVTPTETVTSTSLTTTTLISSTTTTIVETSVLTSTETTIVSTATVQPIMVPRKVSELADILTDSYAASAISSACSCLPARGCYRKGTKTAVAVTSTDASTLTVETTSTAVSTATSTTTEVTTVTEAATTTTMEDFPSVTMYRVRALPTDAVVARDEVEKRYLAAGVDTTQEKETRGYLYLSGDVSEAVALGLDQENRLVFKAPGMEELLTPTVAESEEASVLVCRPVGSGAAYQWNRDPVSGELSVVGNGGRVGFVTNSTTVIEVLGKHPFIFHARGGKGLEEFGGQFKFAAEEIEKDL